MKLSELIAHVGDENIKVQRVDQFVKADYRKKSNLTEITFETDAITVDELMRGNAKMHGLIIWLPKDKLP